MAADVVPYFRPQFLDSNGKPLDGGKVYTYKAGTTTPLVTYCDAAFTQNTNPIILDASGSADIFIGVQAVKFVIYDKNDVLIKTVDRVTGANGTAVGVQTVVAITTNGVQTTFPLGVEPEVAQNCTAVVQPTVGNRIVYMTSEFSVEGQNLIFNTAPPAGSGEIRVGHTRSIAAASLSDGSVTTTKIQDLAVINAKLADNSVSTRTIQDEAVTTAKLPDDSITTPKIPNNAITLLKLAARFNFKNQVYTESSNGSSVPHWTCPAGVSAVIVKGIGGGGGGGGGRYYIDGSQYIYFGGAGGGGGLQGVRCIPVVAGTAYQVTIGAGGAAGAVNSGGGAGGVTSFGTIAVPASYASFGAGQGGLPSDGYGGPAPGGVGGSPGYPGSKKSSAAPSLIGGGSGGCGLIYGPAGEPAEGASSWANTGAGGAGGGAEEFTGFAGGAGGSGLLEIIWVEGV